MKSKLYQYLFIKCGRDEYEKDEILMNELGEVSRFVLAKDENEARMKAACELPEHHKKDLDDIEIVIKPFEDRIMINSNTYKSNAITVPLNSSYNTGLTLSCS